MSSVETLPRPKKVYAYTKNGGIRRGQGRKPYKYSALERSIEIAQNPEKWLGILTDNVLYNFFRNVDIPDDKKAPLAMQYKLKTMVEKVEQLSATLELDPAMMAKLVELHEANSLIYNKIRQRQLEVLEAKSVDQNGGGSG